MDFVLTFEEMDGILMQGMEIEKMEEDPDGVNDASMDGRQHFAVSGGVAKVVVDVIHQRFPDREIKVANAEGLGTAGKLLTMAKAGKYNGYLLVEVTSGRRRVVAGAGTMRPIKKSQATVNLSCPRQTIRPQ